MKRELKKAIDKTLGDGDGKLTWKDGGIIIIRVLVTLLSKKVR